MKLALLSIQLNNRITTGRPDRNVGAEARPTCMNILQGSSHKSFSICVLSLITFLSSGDNNLHINAFLSERDYQPKLDLLPTWWEGRLYKWLGKGMHSPPLTWMQMMAAPNGAHRLWSCVQACVTCCARWRASVGRKAFTCGPLIYYKEGSLWIWIHSSRLQPSWSFQFRRWNRHGDNFPHFHFK